MDSWWHCPRAVLPTPLFRGPSGGPDHGQSFLHHGPSVHGPHPQRAHLTMYLPAQPGNSPSGYSQRSTSWWGKASKKLQIDVTDYTPVGGEGGFIVR